MMRDYIAALRGLETYRWAGRVCELVGLLVESEGPAAAAGDFCEIILSHKTEAGASGVSLTL